MCYEDHISVPLNKLRFSVDVVTLMAGFSILSTEISLLLGAKVTFYFIQFCCYYCRLGNLSNIFNKQWMVAKALALLIKDFQASWLSIQTNTRSNTTFTFAYLTLFFLSIAQGHWASTSHSMVSDSLKCFAKESFIPIEVLLVKVLVNIKNKSDSSLRAMLHYFFSGCPDSKWVMPQCWTTLTTPFHPHSTVEQWSFKSTDAQYNSTLMGKYVSA